MRKKFMYVFSIALCFILYTTEIFAQDSNPKDSLIALIGQTELSVEKVRLYNELAYELRSSEHIKALNYARKALSLAQSIEDQEGIINAYSNIGLALSYSGEYDDALNYSMQGLVLADSLSNQYLQAKLLNNIGNLYWRIDQKDLSYDFYKKSFQIRETIQDTLGMAKVLGNLGNIANGYLKDLDSATYYYKTAMTLFQQLNDLKNISITLSNIGNIEKARNNNQLALQYYHQSLALDQKQNDLYGASFSLSNIGNLYRELNQYDSAIWYFKALLNVANQLNSLARKRQSYQRLALLFQEQKQFDSAFYYLDKYVQAQDSLINQRTSDRIGKLQQDYDAKLQAQELEILQTQSALTAEELERNYWQNLFLVILSLFLLFGLILLIIRYKEKNKLYNALSQRQQALEISTTELLEAKKLIEENNHELMVLNEDLEQRVNERTTELNLAYQNLLITKERLDHFTYRSAHDLKGPISSILGLYNLIKLEFPALQNHSENSAKYLDLIADTAKGMDKLLKRMMISQQINQNLIQIQTVKLNRIIVEMHEFFNSSIQDNEIQFDVCQTDLVIQTDPTILKLILKYLFQNAFQYIDPRNETHQIKVKVDDNDQQVFIHVLDNGIGIEPDLVPDLFKMFSKGSNHAKNSGLGLYDVNLLAEKINASVFYEENDSEFTHFTIKLPKNRD